MRIGIFSAVLGLSLSLGGLSGSAGAQALGPQRQFLAIEPYYTYTRLDLGGNAHKVNLSGYGARLWINLAPFSGPSPNLVGMGAIALYGSFTPGSKDRNIVAYGATHDVFFVRRPLGGVIDPLLTVGAGAYRTHTFATDKAITKLSLSPGVGIRIPVPNRFQLRFDAKDNILNSVGTVSGVRKTANNLELIAAVGVTF
jgi:hypothetical protein